MQRDIENNEWVSAAEAARILGSGPRNASRLAREGFLTERRLPGCDARYLLADVHGLAAMATLPALQGRVGGEPATRTSPGLGSGV